jgi:predicted phosphoribosyltransferase
MTLPRFRDRREAGRAIAEALDDVRGDSPVVFGIPRGGVVLADEIASALDAPLDVLVVRKLGYPQHEEAGFGAVGEDGVIVPEHLADLRAGDPGYEVVHQVREGKQAEVVERVRRYRGDRPRTAVSGRAAIVADDGIATGYTFAAGLAIVRREGPRRLIAAVPVASFEGASFVSGYCDQLVTLGTADRGLFFAVSLYYDEFPQVSDEDVVRLLSSRAGPR